MYVALFYELTKLNLQFINETVRLANIVPGIFRKTLRDIQFKGMNSQYTNKSYKLKRTPNMTYLCKY